MAEGYPQNGKTIPDLELPPQAEAVPRLPPKAYRNEDFLNSPEARMIRIMCELQEPDKRLREHGIDNVVMFFGSARAKSKVEYEAALKEAEAKVAASPQDAAATKALARLKKQEFLVPMYEATVELAERLTKWSQARVARGEQKHVVGTGGGPGMMKAANEGAYRAKGESVGLGISLPFETKLNPYVTPELGFKFHYFFTRKYWMSFHCMAVVVAPGGFGTCDELFEFITLMQTKKMTRKMPVILIGRAFWHACINWDAFVDFGMITEEDRDGLIFADTADEAFELLIPELERVEREELEVEAVSPSPSPVLKPSRR